ncbi:bactofilin family protein [Paraburkholderia dinghuensis]|uniref:Polymer-forming cytoskeletal protein n=1 Tax=Paraburkholderia dinghuensis TaxID=2305225 RepID=A0A3N6MEA3_9BURK|nr:polymer-forming cytoskeletal protein [Paraburkholderia dinghuensis]RQH01138.1 polymer-forming cytoskeletal protein [Paraburkholderia dinghuensis]
MFGKKNIQAGIQQTKLATLIAQDVRITGDVEFADGLRLDGQIRGNVTGKPGAKTLLVLSESSAVEGNVHGYDIVANGRIVGDVIAEHFVELKANAHVTGNIRYAQLQMECGAVVEGRLTKLEGGTAPDLLLAAPEPAADDASPA